MPKKVQFALKRILPILKATPNPSRSSAARARRKSRIPHPMGRRVSKAKGARRSYYLKASAVRSRARGAARHFAATGRRPNPKGLMSLGEVMRGDIVRFKSHSLRVEEEPHRAGNRVRLSGREDWKGAPYVHKWYFANVQAVVERGATANPKGRKNPDVGDVLWSRDTYAFVANDLREAIRDFAEGYWAHPRKAHKIVMDPGGMSATFEIVGGAGGQYTAKFSTHPRRRMVIVKTRHITGYTPNPGEYIVGGKRRYPTLEAATAAANEIHRKTGVFASVEHRPQKTKGDPRTRGYHDIGTPAVGTITVKGTTYTVHAMSSKYTPWYLVGPRGAQFGLIRHNKKPWLFYAINASRPNSTAGKLEGITFTGETFDQLAVFEGAGPAMNPRRNPKGRKSNPIGPPQLATGQQVKDALHRIGHPEKLPRKGHPLVVTLPGGTVVEVVFVSRGSYQLTQYAPGEYGRLVIDRPGGPFSRTRNPKGPISTTKDPRKALQFRTKPEAVAYAKSIGWQSNDARRVDVMGFLIWVVMDDHGSMVSRQANPRRSAMMEESADRLAADATFRKRAAAFVSSPRRLWSTFAKLATDYMRNQSTVNEALFMLYGVHARKRGDYAELDQGRTRNPRGQKSTAFDEASKTARMFLDRGPVKLHTKRMKSPPALKGTAAELGKLVAAMSGMLTVVGNPRRKSRKGRRRRPRSRRKAAVAARSSRRRRARGVLNPRRHRVHNRRRHHVRRRRHSNPMIAGMGMGDFMKGLTGLGVGAIGARLVGNLAKNQFAPNAQPAVKVAIQAVAGIAAGFLVGKFLKQRTLGIGIATGAGVVAALDLYDLFLRAPIAAAVPLLGDYAYGSLNDWAPQPGGMSDYAYGSLNGGNLYDGIYG